MKARGLILAVILFILFAFAATVQAAPLWVNQFGSGQNDSARKIVTDAAGNVYVAGTTTAAINASTVNKVGTSVFVAKFDTLGTLLWSIQFGSEQEDLVEGLSINDQNGFLYVAGSTQGTLPQGLDRGDKNTSAGGSDAFVAKISTADGTIRWIRQFGTLYDDHAYSTTPPDMNGNLLVVGATKGNTADPDAAAPGDHYDIFIWQIQDNGGADYQFPLQFNVADGLDNHAYNIAFRNADNIYNQEIFVSGLVQASPGGALFVAKFNHWWEQQGSIRTIPGEFLAESPLRTAMALDKGGNIYVASYALGSFDGHTSAGNEDIVVVKFDASLNKIWSSQYGTAGKDAAYGVAVDAEGNIYVAGETGSPGGPGLDGQPYLGASDMFLTRLAPADGKRVYTRQLGTIGLDAAYGIAIDPSGAIYLAGVTAGLMGERQIRNFDAVVVKYAKDGPIQPQAIDFYINGTVRELPSGAPLPGVTITVKDGSGKEIANNNGTTDALGQFSVKVPAADRYSIYKLKLGYTAQVNPDVVEVTEAAPTATPVCNMEKIIVKTSLSIRKGYSTVLFTKLPAGDHSVGAVFGKYAGNPFVELIFSLERPMQYLLLLHSGKYGNLKTIEFGRHYYIYSQQAFTIDTTYWVGPDRPAPTTPVPGKVPY